MPTKNNLKYLAITGVVLVIIVSGSLLYTLKNSLGLPNPAQKSSNDVVDQITGTAPVLALESFKSCQDILENVETFYKSQNQVRGLTSNTASSFESSLVAKSTISAPASSSAESSSVYSGTNNQVQNVDEGDIIKTDGKNIFTVNGRNINLSQVDPVTGNVSKVSKISLSQSLQNVSELNLYQNYLLITGSGNSNYGGLSVVNVYDVADSKNPALVRELALDGSITTTRMVDGVVYLVNNYSNYRFSNILYPNTSINAKYSAGSSNMTPKPLTNTEKIQQIEQNLPKLSDSLNPGKTIELAPCEKIKYIRPIQSLEFMTVLALDLKNPKAKIGKEIVLGSGQNVYASEKNLYLTQTNYNYRNYGGEQTQKTSIFKFNLNGTEVKFQTQAQIPGTILNQFSMDEFENNLRVSSHQMSYYQDQNPFTNFMGGGFSSLISPRSRSMTQESNNITILDGDLKTIGTIEGMAPGEQIYATRFMGKKGYLVTFKTIDPLFALDLSDPKKPRVTGQLKIPGYSDYLHPISENLLIGVGKNATEAVDNFGDKTGFAWYQGLKLGLFDVSDMSSPKELAQVEIGDRGTDSAVLSDHKALLWDSRNNLLTIPVTLMLIPEGQKAERDKNISSGSSSSPLYGQFKYQGSYVYEVSQSDGFKLKGRVSHLETKAKIATPNQTFDRKYDEFGQFIESTNFDQENDPTKVIRVVAKRKLNDESGLYGQDKFLCYERPNETRVYAKSYENGSLNLEYIYPNKSGSMIARLYDLEGKIKDIQYSVGKDSGLGAMNDEELRQFQKDFENGNYKCQPKTETPTQKIAIGEPYPNQSDYQYHINRQLYINDFLITYSPKQLQSNKIQDLSLVNNIRF